MTKKEYVEYLNGFPEDSEVKFVVANPADGVRLLYPVEEMFCITGENNPVVCIGVGAGTNMDFEEE